MIGDYYSSYLISIEWLNGSIVVVRTDDNMGLTSTSFSNGTTEHLHPF